MSLSQLRLTSEKSSNYAGSAESNSADDFDSLYDDSQRGSPRVLPTVTAELPAISDELRETAAAAVTQDPASLMRRGNRYHTRGPAFRGFNNNRRSYDNRDQAFTFSNNNMNQNQPQQAPVAQPEPTLADVLLALQQTNARIGQLEARVVEAQPQHQAAGAQANPAGNEGPQMPGGIPIGGYPVDPDTAVGYTGNWKTDKIGFF